MAGKQAKKSSAKKKPTAAEELFWDCAARLYEDGEVVESTMFGFRCLRIDGEFIGMPANDSLWVKLPAERVAAMLADGTGEPCEPNGRRFREWVGIRPHDEELWMAYLNESIEFVRPGRKLSRDENGKRL